MLHLASRSPRRAELLARLGLDFGVIDLDLPEQQGAGEAASEYVRRVAREKAGAGLLEVVAVANAVVLGADTEVILDDRVFGKPADADDAAAMLRTLSGRTHEVITAVSLVSAGREAQAVSISQVRVAPMSDADIAGYIASGEWDGKAGAYAIQGDADRRQHLKATAVLFKTTPPPDADMADPQADNQPPAKPFDQLEEW